MWRFVAPAFEATHRVVLFDHVGAGRSDARRLRPGAVRDARRLRRRRRRDLAALDITDAMFVATRSASMIGVLAAARAPGLVRTAGPRRSVAPLHRRRRLRRRVHPARTSTACWTRWTATTSAGPGAMAPVIMGNADRPELGDGAHQQLLPDRPGDRAPLRPGHVHLGQPRRPGRRVGADLGAAVLGRRHRTGGRRPLRARAHRREHPRAARGHRALPQPECPRGDHGGHRRVPRRPSRSDTRSVVDDSAGEQAAEQRATVRQAEPPRTCSRTRRAATCPPTRTAGSPGSTRPS